MYKILSFEDSHFSILERQTAINNLNGLGFSKKSVILRNFIWKMQFNTFINFKF